MINKRAKTHIHVNVAPLIDVLLVLIVILMLVTYVAQNGIEIDLPKTKEVPLQDMQNEPITVSMDKNGNLYLMNKPIAHKDLANSINTIIQKTKNNSDKTVFVQCDQSLKYGDVLLLMTQIASTTTAKVSLISETDQNDNAAQATHKKK